MSKLAETYLHLEIRLDDEGKKQLQRYLQEKAPFYSAGVYEYELEYAVNIEDGSVKVWLTVAGAIYAGIASYGSFRSGIDYLVKDAQTVSERAFADLKDSGMPQDHVINFQRRQGVPGQIKRALREIRMLENNGRNLSEKEYNSKTKSVRRALERISKGLDHEKDLNILKENIPQQLQNSLPSRLPDRHIHEARLVALRPEEYEFRPTLTGNSLAVVPESYSGSSFLLSDAYTVKESSDGIRFLPSGK